MFVLEYSSRGGEWAPTTTHDSLTAARHALRHLAEVPRVMWRIVRLRGAQREIVG